MDRSRRNSRETSQNNQRPFKNFKDSNDHKQYIGSRDQGQGFADKRKRKAKFEYLKLLRKEKRKIEATSGDDVELKQIHNHERFYPKRQKVHSFWKAEKSAQNHQRKKQEEKEKRHEMHVQKERALEAYNSRKKAQHLKLCKRTKKGQPVMKLQMEVLLDKIKKQKGQV